MKQKRRQALRDIHASSLEISSFLSKLYVPEFVEPLTVLKTLSDAGIRSVLVGLHGIGGWMDKPRATQDVDLVVPVRQHKKAVKVLLGAFPKLEFRESSIGSRLQDRKSGKEAIDVLDAKQVIFREVLRHTHSVEADGQTFRIPSHEMALVLRFATLTHPER